MNKKSIKILTANISYLEKGEAELGTILFIHGNSFSSETFSEQFNSPLFEGYRLIALDLYGHGDSESLLNPFGYHLPQYAKLVIEFAKELGLSNIILAGHSLGGHIALEVLASKLDNLVSGVFIWGTPPISNPIVEENIFLPNPAGAYLYQAHLSNEEIREFILNCFGYWDDSLSAYAEIVQTSLGEARASLGASVAQLNFSDEVVAIKKSLFDIAIIYSVEDKLINSQYLKELSLPHLWQGKCHEVQGSHFCHFDHASEFNKLLLDYIQSLEISFFADSSEQVIKNNITVLTQLL